MTASPSASVAVQVYRVAAWGVVGLPLRRRVPLFSLRPSGRDGDNA